MADSEDANKRVRTDNESMQAPFQFQTPFTIETFQQAFDFDDRKYKCPFPGCIHSGTGFERAFKHCLSLHSKEPGTLEVLRLALTKSKGETKINLTSMLNQAIASTSAPPSRSNSPTRETKKNPHKDSLTKACANAALKGKLPLSFVEKEWTEELVQTSIDIGFAAAKAGEPKPAASSLLVKRRQFTQFFDNMVNSIVSIAKQLFVGTAATYGVTVMSDGRSNINHDALLVFAFASSISLFLFGSVCAGRWFCSLWW